MRDILKNILPKNAKVWVFGSRVKGTVRKASDLPYKVDVVDLQSIDENFKKIINQQKVILKLD